MCSTLKRRGRVRWRVNLAVTSGRSTSKTETVHLYQIVFPRTKQGHTPAYDQKKFFEQREGRRKFAACVVSPGNTAVKAHG